ncbi:MAG: mechanosensitive ion channel domain-containing protein [Gammaproteobacteria bacterium]
MELIDKLTKLVESWIAEFLTISGGLQLGAVVACGALAWLTHRHWQQFITRLLGGLEKQGFIRFFLRATDRAAFPLSMLLYMIVSRFILAQFEINVAVLDIFTPLLLSLAAIRIAVYTIRKGFPNSPALRAWEGMLSLTVWLIVALHLVGWLPDILAALDSIGIEMGEGRFTLLSILKLLTAVVIFMLAANWFTRVIESRTRRSLYMSPSMRVGLTKVSKFVLYTIAFLMALKSVGIDLTTFAVFGGAIGVGIGFGLQKIFSNFISGFILLFDRSIRPGDVISIGTRFGWVQALHARYVVVRDRDGVETLIPNENLITTEVINWSYTDRNVRLKFPVQISYNSDVEVAMQIMLDAGNEHPRVLKDPAAVTRLMAFGDNGIDLELRVWVRDPEAGVGSVRSDVNLMIWKRFKENKIEIPYPQRVIHMSPGTPATDDI